jgi:DNA repair protein SbcC/Rad50
MSKNNIVKNAAIATATAATAAAALRIGASYNSTFNSPRSIPSGARADDRNDHQYPTAIQTHPNISNLDRLHRPSNQNQNLNQDLINWRTSVDTQLAGLHVLVNNLPSDDTYINRLVDTLIPKIRENIGIDGTETISGLMNTMKTAEQSNTSQMNILNKEIEQFRGQLNRLNQLPSQEEIGNIKESISILEQKVATYNIDTINSGISKLDIIRNIIDDLSKKLDKYIATTYSNVGKLNAANIQINTNYESLRKDLEQVKNNINEQKIVQIETMQTDIDVLKSFREETSKTLTKHARAIRKIGSDLYLPTTGIQGRIEILEKVLKEFEGQYKKFGPISKIDKKLEQVAKEIEDMAPHNIRMDIQKLQNQLNTLNEKIGTTDTRITAKLGRVAKEVEDMSTHDIIMNLQKLQRDVQNISQENLNNGNDNKKLLKSLEELRQQVNDIPVQDPKLITNVAELQTNLNVLRQQVNNIPVQDPKLITNVAELQTNLNVLRQQVNNIPRIDPTVSTTLIRVENDITRIDNIIKNLNIPNISGFDERMYNIEKRMDEMMIKVENIGYDRFVDENDAIKSLVVLLATEKASELARRLER